MTRTREFRKTVRDYTQSNSKFRIAIFTEAVNELLAGELDTGKAMLRDYVNATITFEGLSHKTGIPVMSLQRGLGPRGNPTAENLLTIISILQKEEQITLSVKSKNAA